MSLPFLGCLEGLATCRAGYRSFPNAHSLQYGSVSVWSCAHRTWIVCSWKGLKSFIKWIATDKWYSWIVSFPKFRWSPTLRTLRLAFPGEHWSWPSQGKHSPKSRREARKRSCLVCSEIQLTNTWMWDFEPPVWNDTILVYKPFCSWRFVVLFTRTLVQQQFGSSRSHNESDKCGWWAEKTKNV